MQLQKAPPTAPASDAGLWHDDGLKEAGAEPMSAEGAMPPAAGSRNTIAQGRLESAALPHSSPLMKLPMRPQAKPVGTQGAIKSMTSKKPMPRARAHSHKATITPSSPP